MNFILMGAILLLASCSSSNDDNTPEVNLAENIAGSYEGYTEAEFKYSDKPMITPDEKLVLVANTDGTVKVDFKSNKWGTFSIPSATIKLDKTNYQINGKGTSLMGMTADSQKEYEANIAGSVSNDKQTVELIFNIPAVMGGVKVTFTLGEAPEQDLISGEYKGTLEYGVMGKYSTDENSKITIKKQNDGKYEITLQGFGEDMKLGDTVMPNIEIIDNKDGSYLLTGDIKGKSGELDATGNVYGDLTKDMKLDVEFNIKAGRMPFALNAVFTSK